MKPDFETFDFAYIKRHKIEEKGSVGFSCESDKFPFKIGGGSFVNMLKVGCFPAEAGTVINYLDVNLFCGVIDVCHIRLNPSKN